jgi:hypothetical protein
MSIIKLAQYRGEAIHAVNQLGLSADGEALAAITELATKHLLFAIELLMNRLVKSQVIELICQVSPTVDSGQTGERLMKRLASGQPETQASMAALIGKIRSALVPARAALDRSLNMVTGDRDTSTADKQLRKGIETILDLTFPPDDAPTSELLLKATLQKFIEGFHTPHVEPIQTAQSASEARAVLPLATAGSTTTDAADKSFDLAARAKDDGKYEKTLDKLRRLSGDVSPPDGWQERVIRAAHLEKTVDGILSGYYAAQGRHTGDDGVQATELSCYAVGDRVSFLRRRQTEDLWKLGTVTRVESWLRQDGTVGHRIEVNEWLDTIGTLRDGGWIYEDGDESTLRLESPLKYHTRRSH